MKVLGKILLFLLADRVDFTGNSYIEEEQKKYTLSLYLE